MYDELSLRDLLAELGFVEITRMPYNTSAIPGWNEFALDSDSDGTQYKGVSLFMKAKWWFRPRAGVVWRLTIADELEWNF